MQFDAISDWLADILSIEFLSSFALFFSVKVQSSSEKMGGGIAPFSLNTPLLQLIIVANVHGVLKKWGSK